MTKLVEYSDVYALTFVLTEGEKDGESKLSMMIIHQDEPVMLRFNFKYLPDLIGATMDAGHVFAADPAVPGQS